MAGVPSCGTGRSCVRLYCYKNADTIQIRPVCVKLYFGGGGAKNSQVIEFVEVVVSNFIVYAQYRGSMRTATPAALSKTNKVRDKIMKCETR
jgi:hypothetical protein